MYAPSELLEQVKKQVLYEFKDQITYFEWFHEDEYTLIMVEIRSVALEISVGDRIRQIVNVLIGHPDTSPYIVPITVSGIESVDATDGLFNLTYYGAGNDFRIDYDAPERASSYTFGVCIDYISMFEAVRRIHVDSALKLWERLFAPDLELFAQQQGVQSFSKDVLAFKLRDFLLEHLDFIKHIANATKKPLKIIEFEPIVAQSTNKTGHKPSYVHQAREMALPLAAI